MTDAMIRGYSVRQQAAFLHSDRLTEDESRQARSKIRENLFDQVRELDPAGWYPRDLSVEILRGLAESAPTEDAAFHRLSSCGEFIAAEASNTFLRIMMRLLTPPLFAKKLPQLWARDMKGGEILADTSEADDGRIRFELRGVEGYDHIGPVTFGFMRFGMGAVGKPEANIDTDGWSLDSPGPERVFYKLAWT